VSDTTPGALIPAPGAVPPGGNSTPAPQAEQVKAAALSAEQILGAVDCRVEAVHVPEWNGTVYLREVAADVGLQLGEDMRNLPKGEQDKSLYMLLGACLCDADLRPLFKPEDWPKIHTRSPRVLLRLQVQALRLQGWPVSPHTLAGLSPEDRAALGYPDKPKVPALSPAGLEAFKAFSPEDRAALGWPDPETPEAVPAEQLEAVTGKGPAES